MRMIALFIYGTLQDLRVQKSVWGRVVPGEPACLEGFELSSLVQEGVSYPNLKRVSKGAVSGQLVFLSEEELCAADIYEGEEYRRIQVPLKSQMVWVYLGDDG